MSLIVSEMRAGYRWPDDANADFMKWGLPHMVEPEPSRLERVGRALEWGCLALRERVAEVIAP